MVGLGAYLWHAVLGGTSPTPAQLRKCRVMIRHATLWPSADAAQRPTQRDDDRRRAFLQPRRWLAPCETPYFATRGRGEMRGVPNRSTSIAPRRWCGAVLPPWCGVYHLVYHMVACAMTACHHLRGGILGCRLCPPACRRHPGLRNTGLRTAPTAYRGWKLHRLWSASPLWRSSSDGIPCRVVLLHYDLLQKK